MFQALWVGMLVLIFPKERIFARRENRLEPVPGWPVVEPVSEPPSQTMGLVVTGPVSTRWTGHSLAGGSPAKQSHSFQSNPPSNSPSLHTFWTRSSPYGLLGLNEKVKVLFLLEIAGR